MARYRITYLDENGNKRYYMNGSSWENKDIAKHEIDLLEQENIKLERGRSNFQTEPVKPVKDVQLCVKCDNFLKKPVICKRCKWDGNVQTNHSDNNIM